MVDRFQRGSSVYTCHVCKKRTRETGEGEASLGLCLSCFEYAGWENTHSDDDHDSDDAREHPECPICNPKETIMKKKAPRRNRKSNTNVAEAFLTTNRKGKTVFRMGLDARYAGILKRVARKGGTAEDLAIAFDAALLKKVEGSAYFKPLVAAAKATHRAA